MARQTRSIPYLVEREGRYWARVVVPSDVRPVLGKRELRAPLGPDRREAMRALPLHVSGFLDRIAKARHGIAASNPARITRPLSAAAMGWLHYREELAHDDSARSLPPDFGSAAAGLFRPAYAESLRRVAAGLAHDDEIAATIGWAIEKFAARGNTKAERGTSEWRDLARNLAMVQLEAVERGTERDRGEFAGSPRLPALAEKPEELNTGAPVPLMALLDAYLKEKAKFGKGSEARRRWTPVFKGLVEFLEHDDAERITKAKVFEWIEHLLEKKSPKTVKDTDLGSLKAVLTWAHSRDKITSNPTAGVKLETERKTVTREKGFTDEEAAAILKAAKNYQPKPSNAPSPRARETAPTIAAKRWVPWLCAFTGARVAEITQLRGEDVQERDGIHFIRITPDAGSTKTSTYRDVPLHPQIVELGFLEFVRGSGTGPLFYLQSERKEGGQHPSKQVAGRLSNWLRSLDLFHAEVDPSHGWRHRFKTVARELGLEPRVVDAIQGHAARTAGENYGDVTLRAKQSAISKFPAIKA